MQPSWRRDGERGGVTEREICEESWILGARRSM